jgi:hypothetical protein
MMAKTQRKAMEMEKCESKAIANKRRVILDKATLMENGIKIPDLDRFMWTYTKQNYDKHVEWMEN